MAVRYIDPVPVRLISDDTPLPPAEEADARGLVAVGGDLRAERLLDAYRRGLVARFANPAVADTLARLATDASDRIPAFLLPVVHERLAQGSSTPLAALVVAAWARYAEGMDEQGAAIDVVDRRRDAVTDRALRNREEPLAFLRDESLFGDLANNPAFTSHYTAALRSLHAHGARETLRRWLDSSDSVKDA